MSEAIEMGEKQRTIGRIINGKSIFYFVILPLAIWLFAGSVLNFFNSKIIGVETISALADELEVLFNRFYPMKWWSAVTGLISFLIIAYAIGKFWNWTESKVRVNNDNAHMTLGIAQLMSIAYMLITDFYTILPSLSEEQLFGKGATKLLIFIAGILGISLWMGYKGINNNPDKFWEMGTALYVICLTTIFFGPLLVKSANPEQSAYYPMMKICMLAMCGMFQAGYLLIRPQRRQEILNSALNIAAGPQGTAQSLAQQVSELEEEIEEKDEEIARLQEELAFQQRKAALYEQARAGSTNRQTGRLPQQPEPKRGWFGKR